MKKVVSLLILLTSLMFASQSMASPVLSIFWCGFGGNYCGQSGSNLNDDDVNPRATHVILAFVNSNPDGSVSYDDAHQPSTDLLAKWRNAGKKVIISVGGQNGDWNTIFQHPDTFVNSITQLVAQHDFDGVDLDIEAYAAAPQTVIDTIKKLRAALGPNKQIIVSPESVTVYPTLAVPAPTQGGSPWNYFVPILKAAIDDIDYVQPQFYNNPYFGFTAGSAEFAEGSYLAWMNKLTEMGGQYDNPIYTLDDFAGVPPNKLILGAIASTEAGNAAYYLTGAHLQTAISTLKSAHNVDVGGVMLWDSHWDKTNKYEMSNAAADALGIPK
tara:strand:+ start:1428 stop:2408 length:981 start_codon:yes stop_codon:yes gene_type:complete